MPTERTVTVCAECLRASCWHGADSCEDSLTSDVVEKTLTELRALDLEHASYWEEGAGRDIWDANRQK